MINHCPGFKHLIKQWFSEQYQENLDGLILYGSQARGDAQEYSDIDVLVVLKQAFNYRKEIDRSTIDLIDLMLLEQILRSIRTTTGRHIRP